MTVADFFKGRPDSRRLFDALRRKFERIGEAEVRVSKSQVAFWRRKAFARAWMPRQYLGRGAPLVLTQGFEHRDPSPRWKEVVEPRPGKFTHHLELHTPRDLDATTVFPLLLDIFDRLSTSEHIAQRRAILSDLESLLMRRMICELTTKNYNRLFLQAQARLAEALNNEFARTILITQ